MKKVISIISVVSLVLSLSACGGASGATSSMSNSVSSSGVSSSTSTLKSDIDAIGEVEVEKELFDVIVTMPADFVGETTQEELDEQAKEQGIHSVTLNEDGSATYVMSKSQHQALMQEMAASLNESLTEMVGSETYPNITGIKANSDFTEFTVTTTSTELSIEESFSVIGFYMYGGMYAIFNGEKGDVNIHVDFVNADTGNIIESSDSSDMNAE